jgi:hypothetical protein
LVLEIKNNWKLNNVSIHPLVISVDGAVFQNFLKYLENVGLTKDILRGEKSSTITKFHTVCKFLGHAPLSFQTDAEK